MKFSYAHVILTHTEKTCAISLCHLSKPLNVIQSNQCYSHSMRLFCNGVPVSTTLRKDLILFIALEMADWSFFRIWPSSHTIMSGPTGNQKYVRKIGPQKSYNKYLLVHVHVLIFYKEYQCLLNSTIIFRIMHILYM